MEFLERGYFRFPLEEAVLEWARKSLPIAKKQMRKPEFSHWLECGGTWFVGVDVLPNDPSGNVDDSGPLPGAGYASACGIYGNLNLHRGQVSVIYPGYPRPRKGESDAGYRYRVKRDAAHVDGLRLMNGSGERRLLERHAYILGIPLTECDSDASPLVVWEGSHHIMRAAFRKALGDVPEADWEEVDLAEIYRASRSEVFNVCERVELSASPGEVCLLHRHSVHGIAPWVEGAKAPEEGRMVVYFRPEWNGPGDMWLTAA
ncbi:MAG: hypothetical protein OXC72_05615 [Roseovarius sp.]|nr:hypothetical protein [Roseovarius sp.]